MYPYKCKKCGRHTPRISVIKKDKKGKEWIILTCPACNFESDVEEYERD